MAEEFKYLAIKNWDLYQPKDSRTMPWIRDYKSKDFDPEYSRLTVMQRFMLDACCRLRGRHNSNLPNDPLWICRATAILPRERHNATTAIQQLINSGFLVLTNEQDTPLGRVRKGKEGKVKIGFSVAPPAPSAEEENQSIEMDRHSAATTLGALIGMSSSGYNFDVLVSAIDQGKRRWPELRNEQIAEKVKLLWDEYISQPTHVKQSLKNWLDSVGRYIDSDDWKAKKPQEFKPQIDWQGGYVGPDGVYVNRSGKRIPGFVCPPKPKGAEA